MESTNLVRYFEPYLFSASEVKNGKPAPDLLLHAAAKMQAEPRDCIVVEDSTVGVAAGVAAGKRPSALSATVTRLRTGRSAARGRHTRRHLQGTLIDLRGW